MAVSALLWPVNCIKIVDIALLSGPTGYSLYCAIGERQTCSESISAPGKLKNVPDHDGNQTFDL